MTSTIITKNSSTASSVPLAADLTQGELAVNVTDKKLYSKDSGGSVVKLVGSLGNQEANAAAITGGTINGTAIGGTTAAAVSATTLTTSSTVTLNGGTANGLAYLNASKVLTSGSALTFDGTNLGVGTTAPNPLGFGRVATVSDTGSPAFSLIVNGTATADFVATSTVSYLSTRTATPIAFQVNGLEQMRLTSTGLGIGTSSPISYARLTLEKSGGDSAIALVKTGGAQTAYLAADGTNAWIGSSFGSTGKKFFVSLTAPDSAATLDSAGNLGLGVTPSAWFSSRKALSINTGGVSYTGVTDGTAEIWANAYLNSAGNSIYATSSYAALYQVNKGGAGIHAWFTAPSGTAGNAISFTQALTLTSQGYLLLAGTTDLGAGVLQVNDMAGRWCATFYANNPLSGTYYHLNIKAGESNVGSITSNTTTTTYATSSDYRLKNITGPITNSGAYIDSLNPVEGTWKADGTIFVGLIAHEVQEASRTQVATGTKDGAEMQAIDYSNPELIANLIAEVKSLRQRVATLEAK